MVHCFVCYVKIGCIEHPFLHQRRLFGLSAGVAELADALDLGSSGRPCRFKSCHPHYETKRQLRRAVFFVSERRGRPFACQAQGLRSAPVGAKPRSTGPRAPCHPHYILWNCWFIPQFFFYVNYVYVNLFLYLALTVPYNILYILIVNDFMLIYYVNCTIYTIYRRYLKLERTFV